MQDKNKSLLIFGIVFIVIGLLQHFNIKRAGHYVSTFDIIDLFFFGLGSIGFAIGILRFFLRKNR